MSLHRFFRKVLPLLLACIVAGMAGCGYRYTGSTTSQFPATGNIWVAFIANDTVSPTAQTIIRRALLESTQAQRGLSPAASEGTAQAVVTGNLRTYSIAAISYTATDRIREYRLKIDVELELRRAGETQPLWKGMVQAFQDFPASDDLALQRNAEEAALAAASRTLAQRFIATVEQSY